MIGINKDLEKYIFEELEAIHYIDPAGVSSNLNNDEKKNKQYLGTYFPRSFVEAYEIYSNTFAHEEIYDEFNKKAEINILDIGSGTGGNLIGLINVLVERFDEKHIVIHSFDGNKIALNYQRNLIKNANKFLKLKKNKITITTYNMQFKDKADLENKINILNFSNKLDIIHTFKFINEFYNSDYENNKGMYYQLLKSGDKWLANNGIMLILDVTNKVGGQTFNSIIMNNECKDYFNENESKLKYVLPICCSLWNSRCNWNKCFSQKVFYTTHRKVVNEITKVNFKLFIKEPLGKKIVKSIEENYCYEVASSVYCTKDDYKYNCESPSDEVFDPFIL